jgi:hypothetical protein
MQKPASHFQSSSVLDLLRSTYKTVFIPAIDAGKEIGFADKTTRNMLSEGRFPLPTEKIGAKRVVSIFVLADFIMIRSNITPTNTPPARVRGGAPTKAERLKRQGKI